MDGSLSVEAAHHYARVYGPAKAGCLAQLRRAGCPEEEAEEIFAATFERIMRRRDPPREGFAAAQTVALLKRACLQKLIDERRHRDVLKLVPLAAVASRADPMAASPPEAAERREAAEIASEALSSLPERDRRIFLQRHQLDLSPEEILRHNPGLSPRIYRKLLQRARARTREAFVQIAGGMRCVEMQGERLRRYLDREADEAEAREVRAHLRRCPACRFEAARLRGGLHGFAAGLLGLFGFGRERLRELALRLAGGAARLGRRERRRPGCGALGSQGAHRLRRHSDGRSLSRRRCRARGGRPGSLLQPARCAPSGEAGARNRTRGGAADCARVTSASRFPRAGIPGSSLDRQAGGCRKRHQREGRKYTRLLRERTVSLEPSNDLGSPDRRRVRGGGRRRRHARTVLLLAGTGRGLAPRRRTRE